MDESLIFIIGQVVTVVSCVVINKTDINWLKKSVDDIKAELRGLNASKHR